MHPGREPPGDVGRRDVGRAPGQQLADGALRQLRGRAGDLVSLTPSDHRVVAVQLEGLRVGPRRHPQRGRVEVVVDGVAGQLHDPRAEEGQPPLVRAAQRAAVLPYPRYGRASGQRPVLGGGLRVAHLTTGGRVFEPRVEGPPRQVGLAGQGHELHEVPVRHRRPGVADPVEVPLHHQGLVDQVAGGERVVQKVVRVAMVDPGKVREPVLAVPSRTAGLHGVVPGLQVVLLPAVPGVGREVTGVPGQQRGVGVGPTGPPARREGVHLVGLPEGVGRVRPEGVRHRAHEPAEHDLLVRPLLLEHPGDPGVALLTHLLQDRQQEPLGHAVQLGG